MFTEFRSRSERKLKRQTTLFENSPFSIPSFDVENLENRCFLSAVHPAASDHLAEYRSRAAHNQTSRGGFSRGGSSHGRNGSSGSEIAFSIAPAAVQAGLTTLASTDGDTAPTSTTKVYLGNQGGVETYSIHETATGTRSELTVDSTGAAVTAPTRSTTTFGVVTNSAVTSEINAIAAALGLTPPKSTTNIGVSTSSSGAATYSVGLTSTSASGRTRTTHFSVDSNGNPVGDERVPLSVLSTAIQNGSTTNAPTGATVLTSSSLISVRTQDGVTLYSMTYNTSGTRTTISVNSAGALTSGRTRSEVEFSTLPTNAQTELQLLATAEGVTTTIATTQDVAETTEANGTALYSVKLDATSTADPTKTYPVTLTVDADGNPTVAFGINSGHFGGGFC